MSEWTDIGEQLRKARESKGLDLKDVAHTTRIPLATLTALEDSDYSIFPSPTYARSFLSQYSEFLDVDAHEWIDAFETGDVLSGINDHGYLTPHNEHIGEQRHNPEPARRRGRAARAHEDSSSVQKSGAGTSIIQTLTVFFATALLIGGGIYAYKKFEPMLKDALAEEEVTNADSPAETPEKVTPPTDPATPPKEPEKPKVEPPLVAKNDPATPDGGTTTPEKPVEPKEPVPVKPNRTGPPPKALVIDEDE